MEHSQLLIILACTFGLLMTWGVGANDLANIMSTTIGSKAVTVRTAIFIAIFLEFAGAFFGSGHVTETLRTGIIQVNLFHDSPEIFTFSMLSVLLAGTTWMISASYLGLPVSITNATVGAIVGFASLLFGLQAIHWKMVEMIALSWFISPALAGLISFLLFRNAQRFIFSKDNPDYYAKRYIPIYLFLVGMILAVMVVLKGLAHFHILIHKNTKIFIMILVGFIITAIGQFAANHIEITDEEARNDRFAYIEKLFGILMGFTACAMVFAHGSNDVAIAVGPMSAVINVAQTGVISTEIPAAYYWILLWGAIGVIAGFLMYGRRVIETVGSAITTLTPSRAFAATIAAAGTVVVSTSLGIPVSATQTLVGGVLGVGLARGIGALNLTVIRNIFMSWIFTIPAASLLTIGYFYLFRALFL